MSSLYDTKKAVIRSAHITTNAQRTLHLHVYEKVVSLHHGVSPFEACHLILSTIFFYIASSPAAEGYAFMARKKSKERKAARREAKIY